LVKEDVPSKFVSDKSCPAPTTDRLAFVGPLPRELDRFSSVALGEAIVDTTIDRDEVQLTHATPIESEVGRADKIEVVSVPGRRLDDSPSAEERIAARHALDFSRRPTPVLHLLLEACAARTLEAVRCKPLLGVTHGVVRCPPR